MTRLAEQRDRPAARLGGLAWSMQGAVATAVVVLALATWGLLRPPGDQEASTATQRADVESGPAAAADLDAAELTPVPEAAPSVPTGVEPVAVAELALPEAIVLDSIETLEAIEIPEIRVAQNAARDMSPLAIESMTLAPLGERR